MTHFFGIRHHGPGCARSLAQALESLAPDCLVIEGPPEAEAILGAVLHPEIEPPVALLVYCPDDTKHAAFFPFAEFSPEWQAIRFALSSSVPVRFMDLPRAHDFALEDEPAELSEETEIVGDPLDWLGRAAGCGDGETWWNQQVEERQDGDSTSLFAAIQEAMVSLRTELPRMPNKREALREAYMRKTIRQAEKDGFQRIAVVCGAWHLPALVTMPSAKADNDLLKGLPKVKVAATWAPWTYGRLSVASGYGAGVLSPGWYEFLWRNHAAAPEQRSIGWISKVARFMRSEGLDCSSAHVIEATRLSDALAAMRERPAPGLDEINEAVRTVIGMGDDAPLRLIHKQLIVGEKLGRVPPDVPTVPLQQDLEKQQRSLRMKPEALVKELDLDLRNENDLARSHLLHRLRLLGIKWGEVRGTGRSSKGTFHEVWQLQWQPEFAVALIEASRWGQSVSDAASAVAIDQANSAIALPHLSQLVDRVLLANLPHAVQPVTQALENLAAVSADAAQLLEAIPPLANIFRYGNVRQTDASLVGHVLDSLVARACIGLGGACASLDDAAAEAMRNRLLKTHQALKLIANEAHLADWMPALSRLTYLGSTHGLISGLASRLLFDEQTDDADVTSQRVSQALSIGNDPAPAAAWLEGFLHQSGMILLHDDRLWTTVDTWLASLTDDDFTRILPLIRRTFSLFPGTERLQLGQRAKHGSSTAPSTSTESEVDDWNPSRAERPLAVLAQILGL
jgi:hypothetical protein